MAWYGFVNDVLKKSENLSVVSRRVRLYRLATYTALSEPRLKPCGRRLLGIAQFFCKFCTVIGLNALHLKRKLLYRKDSY